MHVRLAQREDEQVAAGRVGDRAEDERRDEARAIDLELAKLRSKLASIQAEIACLERRRRAKVRPNPESPSPSE